MEIPLISGNFKATVSGDISSGDVNLGSEKEPKMEKAQDVINDCGLTYIGQRDGWTNFYKPRLAKGQERSELEFSDANAAAIVESLTSTLSPYLDNISVVVVEHVPSEGASEMKRATALVDSFLGTEKEGLWRQVLDAPADADREALIKLAHEGQHGITPPRKAKA